MKKILLLFAGAAISFLLLSHIDERENLISPLLDSSKTERSFAVSPVGMDEDMRRVLREFNDVVSRAYLLSDPSLLSSGLIDDRLRSYISEEIGYLTREGKVMDLKIKGLKIDNIEEVSPQRMQVSTRETTALRYLNSTDRKEVAVHPEAEYNMVYTVTRASAGWRVTSYETRGSLDLQR